MPRLVDAQSVPTERVSEASALNWGSLMGFMSVSFLFTDRSDEGRMSSMDN
jgi:hypothetical protein